MIELHLRLRARPHQATLLGDALQALARSVRLEPGCSEAHPWTQLGDPDCLDYVEIWESEAALCRALRTAHFTRLAALMETAAEPPALEFRIISEIRGLDLARHARAEGGDDPPGSDPQLDG
jgi:quinol monooxygenase YgiN